MSRSLEATRRPPLGRRGNQPKRDPGAYIGRLPERAPEPDPNDQAAPPTAGTERPAEPAPQR